MNEKSIKLLIENGVVKKAYITSMGSKFHIEFETERDPVITEKPPGPIKPCKRNATDAS